MKTVLGLDVGEKRIGVAWGDSSVKIATPHGVIAMNDSAPEEIQKLIDQFGAEVIVVGLPRNSAGEETAQSKFTREFAAKLDPLGLPIVFQDESLTSVEAENMLSKQQRSNNYNKTSLRGLNRSKSTTSLRAQRSNPAINTGLPRRSAPRNDRQSGVRNDRESGIVDARAAAIILSDYLEANYA